jgi:carboxypeptidase C (cathepsin A)
MRLAIILALVASFAWAQEKPAEEKKPDAKPEEKKPEEKKDDKSKEEKPKESKGSTTIEGREIKYVTKTGTMPILKEDGSGEKARIFFVYYAATEGDGPTLASKNPASRPITFCFNGGPGSAAVWLQFGGLGPKKIQLDPEGLKPATRAPVVSNPNSILDKTDLVFIDPVGTGASRASKGEKPEQFWGVNSDIESVGEFIRLFTTRELRWLSPKFLCGESYGGIRGAGLVDHLQGRHGLFIDGFISVSGVLNFATLRDGNLAAVTFLPAFTATAHYHKKLPPDLQADREKAVAECRAFAWGDYLNALYAGANLPAERRADIITKLARFTGLEPDVIDRANLRVEGGVFYEHLLRKERKIIGRYDGRVTSEDFDRIRSSPEFDPSYTNILGPFAAAANASIRADLGYEFDLPYKILGGVSWSYADYPGNYVNLEDHLASALKENRKLRILLCLGWRDLAVPPDTALYSVSQLHVPESVRSNIRVEYYESGHMMYLNQPDAEKLRKDIVSFIGVPQ